MQAAPRDHVFLAASLSRRPDSRLRRTVTAFALGRLRRGSLRSCCVASEDSQPLLGKDAARRGFEIALKRRSTASVGKGHRSLDSPRTELGGVGKLARVVSAQAVPKIVGQTHVKAFGIFFASENVNVGEFHGVDCLAES